MKLKTLIFIVIATTFLALKSNANDSKKERFNKNKDLLLVQFDCKTDIDDLHSAAALAMLMADSNFSTINYHAVAGTYGTQGGLYVPPNDLFRLAFGDNWTDANQNFKLAVEKVMERVKNTLKNHGDIWIGEAGQSDFTAQLVKAVQADLPKINTLKRIHVVQHSDWNEKSTTPEDLQFVKENTSYQNIPDGNVVGNGSPGFHDSKFTNGPDKITNTKVKEIWMLAVKIANEYNGKEGRYSNEAVQAGGLDFSDLSEVCWILGLEDMKDVEQFFSRFSN